MPAAAYAIHGYLSYSGDDFEAFALQERHIAQPHRISPPTRPYVYKANVSTLVMTCLRAK